MGPLVVVGMPVHVGSMESPKKPALFDLLPALEEFAAVTTELRAPSLAELGDWEDEARERDVEGVEGEKPHWIGSAEDPRATVLGHVAWPAGEAWPWREPDAETMQAWRDTLPKRSTFEGCFVFEEPVPQPFVPVLQLRREDAGKLRYPEGKDLLQVFWHGYPHEWIPTVIVKWRASGELTELATPPMEEIGRVKEDLAPKRQRLLVQQVWVLPDIRTTTRELMRAVAALEPVIRHQHEAYRKRKSLHEQAHFGPGLLAMVQAFFSSGSIASEKPAVLFEKAQALMAETTRHGPVPPLDEPEPPKGYLELGLAKGIRLGIGGMCPQVLTGPLPPVGARHLLTIGEDAWPGMEWVVPRGGGNIHVFVEADEETPHVYCDCWGAVGSSVEDYVTFGSPTRFLDSGDAEQGAGEVSGE